MQEFYLQLQSANFLHCCQWNPACEPIGVVQIVHGVAEHVARYAPFAEFSAKGFSFNYCAAKFFYAQYEYVFPKNRQYGEKIEKSV